MVRFAKLIGADVPACLYSRPVFVQGIGEKLKFIEISKGLDIGVVLINPNIQLSTKKVFHSLVLHDFKFRNVIAV